MEGNINIAYVIPVVAALTGGIVYLFKYIRDLHKEGREDKITMTTAVNNMNGSLDRNTTALRELKEVIIKRK